MLRLGARTRDVNSRTVQILEGERKSTRLVSQVSIHAQRTPASRFLGGLDFLSGGGVRDVLALSLQDDVGGIHCAPMVSHWGPPP